MPSERNTAPTISRIKITDEGAPLVMMFRNFMAQANSTTIGQFSSPWCDQSGWRPPMPAQPARLVWAREFGIPLPRRAYDLRFSRKRLGQRREDRRLDQRCAYGSFRLAHNRFHLAFQCR